MSRLTSIAPEQRRLQYGLGLKPANRATMDAGTQCQEQKPRAEQVASGSITRGRFLALVAVVVLDLAGKVRAARAVVTQPILVNPNPSARAGCVAIAGRLGCDAVVKRGVGRRYLSVFSDAALHILQ